MQKTLQEQKEREVPLIPGSGPAVLKIRTSMGRYPAISVPAGKTYQQAENMGPGKITNIWYGGNIFGLYFENFLIPTGGSVSRVPFARVFCLRIGKEHNRSLFRAFLSVVVNSNRAWFVHRHYLNIWLFVPNYWLTSCYLAALKLVLRWIGDLGKRDKAQVYQKLLQWERDV